MRFLHKVVIYQADSTNYKGSSYAERQHEQAVNIWAEQKAIEALDDWI